MKQRIKQNLITMALLLGVVSVGALAPVHVASAAPVDGVQDGLDAAGNTDGQTDINAAIKTVINVLLFVLGAVAVIMIVLGGIRYTLSNGDSSQITSAKNTILYSVIGLIVALLAYAIVNFVVEAFVPGA